MAYSAYSFLMVGSAGYTVNVLKFRERLRFSEKRIDICAEKILVFDGIWVCVWGGEWDEALLKSGDWPTYLWEELMTIFLNFGRRLFCFICTLHLNYLLFFARKEAVQLVKSSSSSSRRAACKHILDRLSPLFPIVHHLRQVFWVTSCVLT